MMLTSSGPANISGNKVSTSIFMLHSRRRGHSARRPVFDNFQHAAQTLFGAARREQRADRIDRHSLPPNHPPHVARSKAQFIYGHAVALHWSDRYLVAMFHQSFDQIFQESLHALLGQAAAAVFSAFLIKLATVSLAWAPLLNQYWARGRSMVKFSPFLRGWYVPISSMHLPSRGLRLSATTILKAGLFFAPMRFIRIFTAIKLYVRGRGSPPGFLPPAVVERRSRKEGRG